mgnify:CR=1 FL=1|tara:strand:+ start:440 stop:940 length:501 start_codon:yes stop_codon:yes gene_type:complete
MLNQYLEKNYTKLKDMSYNISNEKNYEDLFSFVIEELYKCNKKKIESIIKKKEMTFYIAKIMINQYNSKTSRYYKKYKKYNSYMVSTLNEGIRKNITTEEYDIEKEKKLQWIDDKLIKCHWFDAQVFKIYYKEKHSLNSLSKATKISRATIYKSIKRITKYLKNEK